MSEAGSGQRGPPDQAAAMRQPDAGSMTATRGEPFERVLWWHVAFGLVVITGLLLLVTRSGVL